MMESTNTQGATINVTTSTPEAATVTPAVSTPVTTTTTTPAVNQDWTSSLSDDVKGYVQNKGFKDPAMVLDSYINLEKLMGAPKERLVKLPEKADDPAWNDIYGRLGRPASPEEYKFDAGKEGDANFIKEMKTAFHTAGLSTKQAEAVVSKFNEYSQVLMKAQAEATAQKGIQEETALKKEWGAAYEQNLGAAQRAAREFGMDAGTIDKLESALGFAGVMKLMHQIGTKVGEDKFVMGDSRNTSFGVLTPEAARNRINSLRNDSGFVARYTKGDATAIEEMNKLHQWAYGQ